MMGIISYILLKSRPYQVNGFMSCKPVFPYKQRCFHTVAIKGRRDYDVVNKKRLIWSWMVASLCCRFMHLIFSLDKIQMNISSRYRARKLLHYSCVNGDQHANEQQKVVMEKRGSRYMTPRKKNMQFFRECK